MRLHEEVAPLILLLIREEKAQTMSALVREICKRYECSEHPALLICHTVINALKDAGLVSFQDKKFVATELVGKVQAALGISLSHLSKPNVNSIVVTPIFGSTRVRMSSPDVFVLMPFIEEMKPVYEDHIKNVCSNLGLTVARADDFFSTQSVITEIWAAINGSRILIADCTGRNPNVFYEIGVAHTVGRKVILLSQRENDMPFDLVHIRRITYTYTPRGMKEMEEVLNRTLITELAIADGDE